ncbi:hypothetical protein GCM10023079_20320 [Streptomyces chitinivorans]
MRDESGGTGPEPREARGAEEGSGARRDAGPGSGGGRIGRLLRRPATAVTAALVALASAGTGTWAAGVGPFAPDRYCWGAWEQNSGPQLLGGREVLTPGSERTAKESAAPSPDRPRGTCTLTVTPGEDARGTDKDVTVAYGPVPEGREKRLEWLGEWLDASLVPLPDGVAGLVGQGKGMAVLPEECDVDGRPTAVTITAGWDRIGDERDVADLLLAVAGEGMRRTGCASGEPMRVTSPVPEADTTPSPSSVGPTATCRIPGLAFEPAKGTHYDETVGAVTGDLHLCTLFDTSNIRRPVFAGQFAMVAQPRLRALFHGLAGSRTPGGGWRGKGWLDGSRNVLETSCGDTSTVFLLQLDTYLHDVARPGTEQAFARAVNSVAGRIGCPAPAPRR